MKARLIVTKAIFDEAKKRQVGNKGLSPVKKGKNMKRRQSKVKYILCHFFCKFFLWKSGKDTR